MHDLTQGSIPRHIVRMSIPMAIGMLFQTLYYLADLYFVGRLGDAAIAGVSAAGNIQCIVMAFATLFAHWRPELLIGAFSADPEVVAVAVQYLRTISWNFIASGIVFTCSGMFQAMGNTVPSVVSSGVRVVVFVLPAVYISRLPGFQLHWIWYVSVVSTTTHALFAVWLLKREAGRRRDLGLGGEPAVAVAR